MKKIALLVNGLAGNGSLQRQTYQIIEDLTKAGNEITVFPIQPEKELLPDEFLLHRGNDFDMIVCGGGDGSLNHIVNYLMTMKHKPILGYIPAGTTNDFAKSIKIPVNISEACKVITHGVPFRYDVGQLNDRYFNYIAAFGAFSSISYSTDQSIKSIFGYTAYILSAITEFPQQMNYKRHMKIETDTFTIEDDFIFGAIFSSKSIGGIDITSYKDACLDDGKYEIILVKYPENILDLGQVIQPLMDSSLESPYLISGSITHAKIQSKDIAWSIDGELGETSDEAIFRVHPKAIQIMVPKE